jgi:hypothetical protein
MNRGASLFERFTEPARRIIFFARDEAIRLRSAYIETEHLLLGILREDKLLPSELPAGALEAIQRRIEELQSPGLSAVPKGADVPLSRESKHVLAFADEESKTLRHKIIDCGHLVLGLLREENCLAAGLLREHGIDSARYRNVVAASLSPDNPTGWAGSGPSRRVIQPIEPSPAPAAQRPSARHELEAPEPKAPSLKKPIQAIQDLVNSTLQYLQLYSQAHDEQVDTYAQQRLKRKPWTRTEAFGHLVDWAAAHQQWFARALTEPKLVAAAYPADEWVSAQQYRDVPWNATLDLWVSLNHLLIHVLARIPEDKLKIPCRIGITGPIPLSELIARYVAHCDDVVGQILARL